MPFEKPLYSEPSPYTCTMALRVLQRWRVLAQPPQDFVYIGMDGIYPHSVDLGAGIQSAGSYLVKQAEVYACGSEKGAAEQAKHSNLHQIFTCP